MEKEMIKQREENGACSSYPEWRKNSNEVQMKFCQSCGMPLTDDVLGTNADGSKNEDYCMGMRLYKYRTADESSAVLYYFDMSDLFP